MMSYVRIQIFVLAIVAMWGMNLVSSRTYYATPTTNVSCPEEEEEEEEDSPCLTLSQYANKPNNYFASNTTLVLLPGNHDLKTELRITNLTSLSIRAVATQISLVTCTQSGRFELFDIEQASMSNLILHGCVTNKITSFSIFTLDNCTLHGHSQDGSGLELRSITKADIIRTLFCSNTGTPIPHPFRPWITAKGGGALTIISTNVCISNCHFDGNTADFGGAVLSLESVVAIVNTTFDNNMAATDGGGVYAAFSDVLINRSTFFRNTLTESTSFGGAVQIFNGTSVIENCLFINNTAGLGGGAVDLFNSYQTNHMSNNEFVNNSAPAGSVIIVEATTLETTGYLNIHNNQQGTIFAYNCKLTFGGSTVINNNTYTNSSRLEQDGGAIVCFRSELTFTDTATLSYNKAKQGGAISATESKLNFRGNISILSNNASASGGGIYAYLSELNFWAKASIINNMATMKGGGIHSVGSIVSQQGGTLQIVANSAKRGGGMCHELNSKLYVVKRVTECLIGNNCFNNESNLWQKLVFADNSAEYGGALFVSDDTITSTCSSIPFGAHSVVGECFLQSIALHPWFESDLNLRNTFFFNNTAKNAGSTLYGGLLDRCTASSFAEIFRISKYSHLNPSKLNTVSYFLNLTNIRREDIQSEVSSDPVRVCFCKNGRPDCSYDPPTMFLRKGETFSVSLVAVDHVNNTIPYTHILNSVTNGVGLSNAANRVTHDNCTVLNFNIFSSHKRDQVFLYPSGPCKDTGVSKFTVQVTFKSCPIGFIESKKVCKCDPILHPKFVTNCSIDDEAVIRRGTVWISLLNESDSNGYGYMVCKNCPFDYCHQPAVNVLVNLNMLNGSDSQCAFNRSGVLCGACKDGLSLSLGSSRCMSCSNNWLALLIVFAIAGVALVAFILMFNVTVAEGTINGLIFYANIIAVHSAVFFPPNKKNILTIFVSWLNLDFGFETCFFTGLDGYSKTWLQFVFPVYILVLVVCIVVVSHYSTRFAQLISNRKPVPTLATLILLSYAKLLRTVIAALSFATVQKHTSDGNVKTSIVWLIDAKIGYFQGKHIPLFFVALFVLIIGLIYTFLLILWQWIQHLPKKRCLRWIGHSKLNVFMEAYHAPYSRRLRYWTGLLLLVRVVLYLMAALNIVHNSLLSIACVVGALSFLRNILQYRVYRRWSLNALESSFVFNLVIFATATLYVRESGGSQAALAYISTSISFLTFSSILVYHAFVNFKSLQKLKKSVVQKWSKKGQTRQDNMQSSNENELSARFTQLRESLNIFDHDSVADDLFIVEQSSSTSYKPPKLVNRAVTQTVVDVSS